MTKENGRLVLEYSCLGYPYHVWEPESEILSIPLSILACTFYLYPSKRSAEVGEGVGGTGFFVSIQYGGNKDIRQIYGVTAGHVIKGGNRFIRINTASGKWEILGKLAARQWIHHPDGTDIAVFPFDYDDGLNIEAYDYRAIETTLFSKKYWLEGMRINSGIDLGDRVFMVGRYIGIEGIRKNIPMVRFGNISMLPCESLQAEEIDNPQECFLVDCRAVEGFSGSPVFTCGLEHSVPPPRQEGPSLVEPIGSGPYLLGVVSFYVPDLGYVEAKNRKTKDFQNRSRLRVRLSTGMAGVVPAWKLEELLNSEELDTMRKKKAKRSIIAVAASAQQPFTKADFQNALKKVSRRVSKLPETKS